MHTRNPLYLTSLLLLLFAASAFEDGASPQGVAAADADKTADPLANLAEPAFPMLFYDSVYKAPIRPRRVKLLTEVIGSDFRRTNEEYVDIDQGTSAYVVQNGRDGFGSEVLLADSTLNRLYKYKPYTCQTMTMEDESLAGMDYWSIRFDLGTNEYSRNSFIPAGPKELRVFGLSAMWLSASEHPKTYKRESIAYNAGKDIFRLAHSWTLVDETNDAEITFLFMSSTFSKDNLRFNWVLKQINEELSLEMVQIQSRKTRQVLRTINLLSIDYELSLSDYENILKVPVGYGCKTSLKDERQEKLVQEVINSKGDFWDKYLFSSSKIDLEVTATKIDASTSQRATETLYVEVAHVPLRAAQKDYDLMMTKIKSKDQDSKSVLNHLFNVKYDIDLQRGSCHVTHMRQPASKDSGERDEELHLSFSNGLKLALGKEQIGELFSTINADFETTKVDSSQTDSSGKSKRLIFMEKTLDKWPLGNLADSNKVARLIRTYVEEVDVNADFQQRGTTRLESVTIWVLENPGQTRILEIYHLNVIDEEGPLSSWPDVPALFDVSQECYLDNEQMRPGLDYAWVEFFYPVASRQLDLMVESEDEVKEVIYTKLVSQYAITSPRVPRFELIFSDEGLIVRALILDLPPLSLLYEPYEKQTIVSDKTRGDLQFVAPDLKHCANLCQLYHCKSMSYCEGARTCLLGTRGVKAEPRDADQKQVSDASQELVANQFCTTFSVLETLERHMDTAEFKYRLKDLLSMMSHQDYDLLDVPKMPDELTLPRSESGLTSDADYKTAIGSYMADVLAYLTQKGSRAPTLVVSMMLDNNFVILLPSKFSVENDPLDGLALGQDGKSVGESDDIFFDSTKVVSFFHEGLAMSRFKFNAFQGALRDKSSLLNGLSYDQCALGCLDSKCGTFSYCSSRKECILTTLNTISEASADNLIETDNDCMIAQRDFAKNYQKYPQCERPSEFHTASRKESVSDCALACLLTTEPNCMSFEFCQLQEGSRATDNCFIQLSRQPDELFATDREAKPSSTPKSSALIQADPTTTGCDHYERSYLAEFNQIESRTVAPAMLDQLKTTEHSSAATPMECADLCLNQVVDCSAFQFCFDPAPGSSKAEEGTGVEFKYSHTCTTIESKPASFEQQEGFEALIDSRTGSLVAPNKFLDFDRHCNVFALRPDTIQAHLRDLAMGNTMSLAERRLWDEMNAQGGVRMSWARYIFMFLSVALCSALLVVGICYARERNEHVRSQLDQLNYQIDRLRSRLRFL